MSLLAESLLLKLVGLAEFFSLVLRCLARTLYQGITLRLRFRDCLDQIYQIGVQSIPVVLFSIAFLSLMLIAEFTFHMKLILRQASLVPAFSTLLMVREIGPVFSCLLLTSRVGASIAAEIGLMRLTEQLDALKLMGLEPIDYLTIPRLVGCIFSCLCVSVLSISFALFASAFMASRLSGFEPGQFLNTMFVFTRITDLPACLLKTVVFGTLIPLVASYHGFRCQGGAHGVGNASTMSVVHTSMLIIISDFFLTYLMFG